VALASARVYARVASGGGMGDKGGGGGNGMRRGEKTSWRAWAVVDRGEIFFSILDFLINIQKRTKLF
jgi:hypothetical protein